MSIFEWAGGVFKQTFVGDNKMKILIFITTFFISTASFGQKTANYLVVHYDTTNKEKFGYVFTNQKGDTITRLDTAKYYV